MKEILNRTFDEERALYGESGLKAVNCSFDGPADGESAFKEGRDIEAIDCYYNLRYPFWHDTNLRIEGGEMTENCRAALWYSKNIEIENLKMHGIKALRECENVKIKNADIVSPEFGWSVTGLTMEDSKAESEYFLMRSKDIAFDRVEFKGKYSFQYIENATFTNCLFDTKDAFWHAKNVVVKDSIVNGEYLAWYSENVTFINCKIKGTQPFCYANSLKLIDCTMEDADLSFEKSDVDANILGDIVSIKNPKSGRIVVDSVGEIIRTDEEAKATIEIRRK